MLLTTFAATVITVLLGATAASAHVEPDPPAIEAGKQATVGFGVEHGCDGSNTNSVAIKVPASITDAAPVDKEGWTAAVAAGTITFSGGDLDAHTADSFEITFTAPATPGDIAFPIVQTCAVGELAWIESAVAGQPEPEHPAPLVKVTDGPPTSADLAPEHDDGGDDGGDATHAGDGASGATATSAAGAETTTEAPTVTAATTQVAPSDDGDDSNTSVIVIIVVVAVVVVGGAAAVALRRRGGSSNV